MRALCLLLFLAAADEEAAIRQVISTFNVIRERTSVLARNADIRFRDLPQQERSQTYFETTSIRFVTADVALADANANRYGSVIVKETAPAVFILKKEGADWKIDSLRVLYERPAIVPVKQ